MRIRGMEKLSPEERDGALAAGGRFVFYEYCISLVFATLRRPTDIYFLRRGDRDLLNRFRFALVSFLFGWWGIPWGFIYTPLTIIHDLSGGQDVTDQVRDLLGQDGNNSEYSAGREAIMVLDIRGGGPASAS